MVTDMAPSLSLMYEKPETDLLSRPPRIPKIDPLVNWKLLFQAYLFIGMIESFFSHLMFFVYLKREWGVNSSQLIFAYEKWGVTDGVILFRLILVCKLVSGGSSNCYSWRAMRLFCYSCHYVNHSCFILGNLEIC